MVEQQGPRPGPKFSPTSRIAVGFGLALFLFVAIVAVSFRTAALLRDTGVVARAVVVVTRLRDRRHTRALMCLQPSHANPPLLSSGDRAHPDHRARQLLRAPRVNQLSRQFNFCAPCTTPPSPKWRIARSCSPQAMAMGNAKPRFLVVGRNDNP